MREQSRINWMDWAKVLAIVLVVFGHIPQVKGDFLINYVCTFHMPFFMMLSGYLSKVNTELREVLKKLWHTLIVTYLIYNAVFYPYWTIRYVLDEHGAVTWFDMVVKPLFGTLFFQIETPISSGLNGATWFLMALMAMRLLLTFFYRLRCVNGWLFMSVICCVIIDMWSNYNQFFDSLFFNGLFGCYPFFVIGHFLRKNSGLKYLTFKNDFISAVAYGSVSLLFFLNGDCLLQPIWARIVIPYAVSISACLAFVYACRLMNGYTSQWLVNLSSGTIAIMGLHWMFIGTINYILEELLNIRDITYHWALAIFIAVGICLLIYPFIVFSLKYCPQILGKQGAIKNLEG